MKLQFFWRSLLSPCNSCQAQVVFRGRSWQVGLARAQQDWGVFTVNCQKITWDCTCNLTCEFKHHTNVTTCDIISFFNQPQPQPNNTTNGNHNTTPNTNNNPQTPCHHNWPKNEDGHPQTTMNTHQNQWLPGSWTTARSHEQTWAVASPGE